MVHPVGAQDVRFVAGVLDVQLQAGPVAQRPGQARQALRQGSEGRHALRIQLKKLRYAQEFLASLLPAKRLRRSTAALTEAQERLGSLNDLNTALALLGSCPLPAAHDLREKVQARLGDGLRALPRLERTLMNTPTPWG